MAISVADGAVRHVIGLNLRIAAELAEARRMVEPDGADWIRDCAQAARADLARLR